MGTKCATECGLVDPVLHPSPEWFADIDEPAAKHDTCGIKDVHEVGHANGDIGCEDIKQGMCVGVIVRKRTAYVFAPDCVG
jgi:hypothetical protein